MTIRDDRSLHLDRDDREDREDREGDDEECRREIDGRKVIGKTKVGKDNMAMTEGGYAKSTHGDNWDARR